VGNPGYASDPPPFFQGGGGLSRFTRGGSSRNIESKGTLQPRRKKDWTKAMRKAKKTPFHQEVHKAKGNFGAVNKGQRNRNVSQTGGLSSGRGSRKKKKKMGVCGKKRLVPNVGGET